MMTRPILCVFLMVMCIACDTTTSENKTDTPSLPSAHEPMVMPSPKPTKIDDTTHNTYSWLETFDTNNALVNRIATPSGYRREKVEKNSFADWLRHLPLKPEGTEVRYFNGSPKHNQNIHTAVIDMDTGKRDLQQCADAVMRLKAEYHYGLKEYEQIHFNYTSGDMVGFDDWRKGRKPIVTGNLVTFTPRIGKENNAYRNFKQYMNAVFNYAGTYSLSKEMRQVPLNNMQIGDVFIQGGFPGHAVIVVDIAVQAETGKRLFLIAQSYMPAQDMHVLINPNDAALSPWYALEEGELQTPEWSFTTADLKRF